MTVAATTTGEIVERLPARRSDPETSQQGAAMPHLPAQRLAVLTALVALGDATAWQIVDRLDGPESGTVRSRLAQLHRAGYAAKVGSHVERRGAGNTVWRATVEGRRVVAAIGGPT